MVWVWTGIIVATLIFEFLSSELVCIWFSASGLISLILALCGVVYWVQIIVFVVVAIVLLLSLRKICLKLLQNNKEKTNVESLIGRKLKLLTPITEDEKGSVKINDVVWSCIDKDGHVREKGEEVEVVEVRGNKIVVKGGN